MVAFLAVFGWYVYAIEFCCKVPLAFLIIWLVNTLILGDPSFVTKGGTFLSLGLALILSAVLGIWQFALSAAGPQLPCHDLSQSGIAPGLFPRGR